MKRDIIFLYQSLADYIYSSMIVFVQSFPKFTLHIVNYPINKYAPFHFKEVKGIYLYDRTKYDYNSLIKLCEQINPSAILVSGFSDKTYLRVAFQFKSLATTKVFLLDNYWKGTLRQYIGLLFYRFIIKRIFSKVWVPGIRQYSYANLMGFDHSDISLGLYAANTDHFLDSYKHSYYTKVESYPKVLLFVGRLVKYKWVVELISCFIELDDEGLTNDWELLIVGEGPLNEILPTSSKITYKEFLQPHILAETTKSCGAFCLPSDCENFGVVVQEFTAAGLPIICSDSVGAHTDYVINNYNGFVFKTKDRRDFKEKLKELFYLDNSELLKMGTRSSILSTRYTKEQWVQHLSNYAKS